MARTLGLDYGERRMGFAVSDPSEILATPLCVVTIRDLEDGVRAVCRLVQETGAERLVVGLPVNMNGTRGEMVARVEAFLERLAAVLSIPVMTWDERLTSTMVERAMRAGGASRARRDSLRDMLAAQAILQSYLDARQPPQPLPELDA